MVLGDMANLVLTLLQQPGAAFVVGGGTATGPTYPANSQFGQGLVEFCINEGYKKFMGDIEDIELALVTYTFTSTATTYKYSFPPAGYAAVSHVARLFYQPSGLTYTREFRPGTELISWAEFQKYTGQGYLNPYAFGTLPTVATIDPTRTMIYFFKGSARAGDTITVEYAPIPTNPIANVAATGCPILTAATDAPIVPADCHMAIVYYALSLLWTRAREAAMALQYYNPGSGLTAPGLYQTEVKVIRQKYTKLSHGDTIRIEKFMDPLSIGRA